MSPIWLRFHIGVLLGVSGLIWLINGDGQPPVSQALAAASTLVGLFLATDASKRRHESSETSDPGCNPNARVSDTHSSDSAASNH